MLQLAEAPLSELETLLRPLGLWHRRSRSLLAFARQWIVAVPLTSYDVLRLPGCGRYAADSWSIFIENKIVKHPSDRYLAAYVDEMTRAP